jgi:DNA-binding NarL/FixJ family response regulator
VAAVTIRVLVVEDHPIAVGGITGTLASAPGMEVAGQAATLADARRLVRAGGIDIVLLDLRLPDGSGMELLEEAATADDAPGFLVLSSFMTPEYVAAALALGAGGFVLKTAEADEILAAISTVADGRLAFSTEQVRAARSTAWAPLTQREHEILEGVVAGRSNDELAAALDVSSKTVEKHLARLFARFGAASRTELALAVDRGAVLDLPTRERRPGPR